MKGKVIREATIKTPKAGDQFCDFGVGRRYGFSCEKIVRITKNWLILESGQRVHMSYYVFKKIEHARRRKLKISWRK